MNRLRELATIARQTQATVTPVDENYDTHELIDNQHFPALSRQPETILHPCLSDTQQLQIAQVEWAKVFSRKQSEEFTQANNRQRPAFRENHRDNNSWGDQLRDKPNNVTRVYSLNANGLSIDRRGGRFDDLCKITKEVQADVVCCQEHNLDTTQTHVRSVLYDTARNHWSRTRLQVSTTPIPFVTTYKPGGTMMFTVGDASGRVLSQSQDKWGRWTSQTLRGSGSVNITIISAYQVVSDNPHTGLTTTTSQQQSLLLQTQDPIHSPRKAFKRDLLTFLQERIFQQEEILLVGDFNEPFGDEIDGMSHIASTCDLINVMQVRHQQQPPATYSRGRKCLDYGLATRRVAEALLSCGYEAFNERFQTDHRAYFFDFSTDGLFGNRTQPLAPPSHRLLKSNNIEQVTQYITLKFEYLESRNAFRRADQLHAPGDRHEFAERLDSDTVKASLDAERNTKSFREPAWSIALSQARRKLVILKKHLSMYRTGLDHSQILQRDITTLGVDMDMPTTKSQCISMIRDSQVEVDTIVKESFLRRDQEIDLRIRALEQTTITANKQHATILRRLKRAERIKRVFDKLKLSRERGQRQGVTRLEIPNPPTADPKQCTEWQTIDVPSEIVENLQRRNRQHFGQAHGTPFTIDPLQGDLGFCGDSSIADNILHGMADLDRNRYPESVNLLLHHLQITHEMSQLTNHPTVSFQEFQGKIKAWRESTTTSPSGLHLGHYKSLFAKHKYSHVKPLPPNVRLDDAQTQEHNRHLALKADLDYKQQSLAELHVTLLNYAVKRGYSFLRWQSIANTILFKDPGCVKIHRTRVIHIYEADFNLMLGVKWRNALYQAELLKSLNEGQFGSRPRRNAVDPVMLEELQFELSRLSRRTLLQTNYDATACYDRIIPNLAMMASRKFGVAKSVTQSNANTLLHAKFHIRTEVGLSESSYSHSLEYPIYGTGQGSGNSPMIWCFLSSLLYDCYDLAAYPAKYCNPDWSNENQLSMVGFVDDSNGQVNSFYDSESRATLDRTLHKARHNATTWSQLLQTTGGALELSKCSYHVLYWKFSIQGAPVLSNIKCEIPPLQVTDSLTGVAHTLEYLPPSVAHKTLGHYKEPSGLQKTQYRQLKAKSESITEFLWTTHLTREEAWTYYQSCYIPAITYPLTSSFLTMAQLSSIQTKAMAIITAKCGFNRNTKKEVLFGPKSLGGAEFRHLITQQGIAQTTYFLRHWRSQSSIGRLLKCTVSWMHMSAGMSYSLLEDVATPIPHLESKWLQSLRQFLASVNASLQLDDPCVPEIQRDHDCHLMDMILQSKRFTPAEIRKLNYCRLYLQAVTLADITTPNGCELDRCFLQGTTSLYSGQTRWHTVHQERPSENEWKLWRAANAIWSNSQGQLLRPLGKWLHPLPILRFSYFAYKHRRTLFLRVEASRYHVFHQRGSHMYRPSTTRSPREYSQLPKYAFPVEVATAHDCWIIRGDPSIIHRPPVLNSSATATFDLFIETLAPWEIELMRQTTLTVDPYSLCLALTPGFRAVSDGSVREQQHGSFGWVLSTLEGERLAFGMGPARARLPHSYRAEAYGILSILCFLLRVKEYTGMHEQWQGVIATDSQGVLDTLQDGDPDPQEGDVAPIDLNCGKVVLDCLRPDWDILIEIQEALANLPGVTLQYVQGHQDRRKPIQALDLMGQLNVEADKQAATFNQDYGASRPYVLLSPHTKAHLLFNDGTITGHYQRELLHAATYQPLMTCIKDKNRWHESTLHSIQWAAHALAIKKTVVPHTHLVKYLHYILPTHGQLNKYDGGSRKCPLCGSLNEDWVHVLQCSRPSRTKWRDEFLESLRDTLSQSNTSPLLSALLLTAITQWFQSTNECVVNPQEHHHTLYRLICQQNRLGWQQMFLGRFSSEWSKSQAKYLDIQGCSEDVYRQSITWQVNLIQFVWERWYTLWKQRNQEVHGHDERTRAEANKREVRRQLDEIYRNRHMYEEHVQTLLHRNAEDHDRHPVGATRNWLSTNATIFKESYRRVKRNALGGMQSIRTYFGVAP